MSSGIQVCPKCYNTSVCAGDVIFCSNCGKEVLPCNNCLKCNAAKNRIISGTNGDERIRNNRRRVVIYPSPVIVQRRGERTLTYVL